MKIIERLKQHLEETGMTQTELAAQAGVHYVTLSNILNGKTGTESALMKLDSWLEDNKAKIPMKGQPADEF